MMATPIIKFRKDPRGEKNAGNEDKRDFSMLMKIIVWMIMVMACSAYGQGIAQRYPHDVGIENDPRVLLYENFESVTQPVQLRKSNGGQWDWAGNLHTTRIASEPGNFYAGRKALEMLLPIASHEQQNVVLKRISPEEPVLYVRAYEKWDPGFSAIGHNGIRMSGDYPGAGSRPPRDGSGFFLFLLQNSKRTGSGYSGYSDIYAYWPLQRDEFGDHWYPDGLVVPGSDTCGNLGEWLCHPALYPNFANMPNWQPLRGVWYCFEFMVKLNTLGQRNGEIAYWVNGQLKGRWTDLFIRSRDSLKIDTALLNLQSNKNLQRVQKKWYDSVVIARSYIGPINQ
jgi:hypothetical protein